MVNFKFQSGFLIFLQESKRSINNKGQPEIRVELLVLDYFGLSLQRCLILQHNDNQGYGEKKSHLSYVITTVLLMGILKCGQCIKRSNCVVTHKEIEPKNFFSNINTGKRSQPPLNVLPVHIITEKSFWFNLLAIPGIS